MRRHNAFRVIVRHCVNSRTYRKASHLRGVERHQNLCKRLHILEAGIEPQIVVLLALELPAFDRVCPPGASSEWWLESSKTQSQRRQGLSTDPTTQQMQTRNRPASRSGKAVFLLRCAATQRIRQQEASTDGSRRHLGRR